MDRMPLNKMPCGACIWFEPTFGYRPGYEFKGHHAGRCGKSVRLGVYEDEVILDCIEFVLR